MRLILTKAISNPIVQLVTAVGLALVLRIAIADAIHGRMSMGDLLGFFIALVSIAQPLRELVGVTGPLQQGIAAGQSLFELLDEPAEPQGGSLTVLRVRGEVEFDQVSFATAPTAVTEPQGAAALVNVSLKVASGESLAIVGRSGSGKSTLVNLLPRFYDATAGSVRIDGVDVRDYHAAEPARADRGRQPGRGAVRRHHPQQHRLRARRDRCRHRARRRGRAHVWNSCAASRRAWTPWSAIAACCSRAASASASPSRARC